MKLSTVNLRELSDIAKIAATEAGAHITANLHQPVSVHYKEGMNSKASSVVTQIDLECQNIILATLEHSIVKYDLGLLTEESVDNKSRFDKDYFWCIDPLDGTLAYSEKRPGYAVSIALVSKAGEPVIGVVYEPVADELSASIKGQGFDIARIRKHHNDNDLKCFLDYSFKNHSKYDLLASEITQASKKLNLSGVKFNYGLGAVMNAYSVLTKENALYLKLPKETPGGGSIWDFAATSCLFIEANLPVSDCFGNDLALNNSATTFMHKCGVLFTSNQILSNHITSFCKELYM